MLFDVLLTFTKSIDFVFCRCGSLLRGEFDISLSGARYESVRCDNK